MLPIVRTPLGAPGAFALPALTLPTLHPQRMDVCAFVGVAPRGPAWVPVVDAQWPNDARMVTDPARPLRRTVAVPVRSFDEYRRLFGGFEGPGLLPHAVASYFEQGGRIAWIARIVHDRVGAALGDDCAKHELTGPMSTPMPFFARNPGRWGDNLRAELAMMTTTLAFRLDGAEILVDPKSPVSVGCTLRFTDNVGAQSLSLVTAIQRIRDTQRASEAWRLTLDLAPAAPVRMELVEARIDVFDGLDRREHFAHLALAPEHPESVANVLCRTSALIWPHPDWAGTRLVPADPKVEGLRGSTVLIAGGSDHWDTIIGDDFFDALWTPSDEAPGNGLAAVANGQQITQLVLPDLYLPAQWAFEETVDIAGSGGSGSEFAPCADIVAPSSASSVAPSALTGLILDPATSAGLDAIVALQQRVVSFCEQTADHIALIDVPPGLSQGRTEQWRAAFDSSWAAAYHPWLIPTRQDADDTDSGAARRRQLPPSAVAAGIVASRELEKGIQYGPANRIAREIIHFAEPTRSERADTLHPLHVNCFARQPDGIALLAARTLSRDTDWRQLSVRRLMLMLCRTLRVETQWAVFEPNGPELWRDLKHAIESLLRRLFRAGAFAGRTEAESFFVRLETADSYLDRGQLLVLIGVAPAEPLEFILVRLRRDGDGTLNLESS